MDGTLNLFDVDCQAGDVSRFPATRYQGSKRKILGWIAETIKDLPFESALDAFGGTGSVAYLLKTLGKQVTYNDTLQANHQIGVALIQNNSELLTDEHIQDIFAPRPDAKYDDFIARTFSGIYFTDEENEWLDIVVQNIPRLEGEHVRAAAWFALFQACIAKRPYNLFHRRNLYMRTADVGRSFGNKATWDRSFREHFCKYAAEANKAIFQGAYECFAQCGDALQAPGEFDLVYIDPPYVSGRNVGVDYHGFYHFLEGMVDYPRWPGLIDESSKHRRLAPLPSDWLRAGHNGSAFGRLFEKYQDSILVISYRSDGRPSIDELTRLLRRFKPQVQVSSYGGYQYALSKNRSSKEVLLVGV